MKRPIKGVAIDETHYEKLRFPLIGFPKIDGFRCVLGSYAMTSRLARFPNHVFHRKLKGLLPDSCLLDSEVTVGSRRGQGVLTRTSSGLTSEAGDPDFTLWVFDYFHRSKRFVDRYLTAQGYVKDLDLPFIRMLKYTFLEDIDDLQEYLDLNLARGYEGIILRSPDGIYKEGKSTLREQHMLKIKPFEDFEARITGYFEEEENTNEAKRERTGKLKRSSAKEGKRPKGTLGGFIGEVLNSKGRGTGVKVRVGGGFTAGQRKDFWAIRDELVAAGAVMECYKQKMGEKDKPRHPNFRRIRPGWDLTDY